MGSAVCPHGVSHRAGNAFTLTINQMIINFRFVIVPKYHRFIFTARLMLSPITLSLLVVLQINVSLSPILHLYVCLTCYLHFYLSSSCICHFFLRPNISTSRSTALKIPFTLAYSKFSGAQVTASPIDWTWKTLSATVPELVCGESSVTDPTQILNFLRKQRFNADYELTARQGADTLAYIALLEEKLRPALLHTFWVDAENYANVTRPWFASHSPFPLNFVVPLRQANIAHSRILLTKGVYPLNKIDEIEAKLYSDAKECLNLLSYRLGTANYFFGSSPTSLDAFVFGFLAPLYKAGLPSSPLQSHLSQLENLTQFCDNILAVHFSSSEPSSPPSVQETKDANLQKLTQLVNKESNLIEKMDDNLRSSSPQHRPHRPEPKPSLANENNSTPA